MSMLDSYKRTVQRKREELGKLRNEKARESEKLSKLNIKINSASQTISRSSSQSTINSKMKEIERYQNDAVRVEKKIADYDRKIAAKDKEIINEEKKVSREEKRENDKKIRDEKQRLEQYKQQMRSIDSTLNRHENMHQETKQTLQDLQKLPEKITILFIATNPLDQDQLRLDEEVRSITEMIRKTKHRDSLNLQSCWATRPLDLLQELNTHKPSIIHFSGHGSSFGELVFQGDSGETKLVTPEALIQLVKASCDDVRLIFLNACHSSIQAKELTQYVNATIGMSDSIGDDAARVFAAAFYSAIGFGHTVGKAFEQGKAALMLENIPEEDIPELFVCDGYSGDDVVIVSPGKN